MKTGFYGRMIIIVVALLAICGMAVSGALADGSDYRYEILPDETVMLTGYIGTETNLILPETIDGHTVSTLGDYFSNTAQRITCLTIPNTLTIIQPGALLVADKLEEIRVDRNHPNLEFRDGVLYDKKERSILLYLQTNTAVSFSIPDGTKVIGGKAFFFAKLVSVNIPGSVERIDELAFEFCENLKHIYLHEGLKTIGENAFYKDKALEKITIPASVTEIGEGFVSKCNELREIIIEPGNGAFAISDGALINVRDGILIAYPAARKAEKVVIPAGITRIGGYAFDSCENLKQVVFPDGLKEVGDAAFISCTGLTSLDLPDSVEKLDLNAFYKIYNVTYLHIPAGLKEIRWNNFMYLAITELSIPDSVTYISNSFSHLKNLTEAVIPNSVTEIGSNVFSDCENLVSITIPASVTKIAKAKDTFTDHSEALVIKVEAGSYAEQWCRENGFKYEVISSGGASPVPVPQDSNKTAPTSRSQVNTSSPLSSFMAEFAGHTDNLEESFTVPCSGEMQKKLLQNDSVSGNSYLKTIATNEGIIKCSYQQNPDSIEFINCRYYEGKRIVHAVRTGTVSALTAREKRTLEKAQQMVAGIKGSELEKEKAIHDLLCEHVTYNRTGQEEEHGEKDCAIGAILDGSADCDGYSDAFYLLASLTGLRVRYQDGKYIKSNGIIENHMWNLVNISGRWVALDVTNDDQDDTLYVYFNIGTDYIRKNHRWDENSVLVTVEKEPLNDFRPAGLEWSYVTSQADLQSVLENRTGKQERICLRYPESFNLQLQYVKLKMVLQKLGVKEIQCLFGPDCMELFIISMW